MIYVLDANVISDLLAKQPTVRNHLTKAVLGGQTLAIFHSTYYELLRGLLWRGATAKLTVFEQQIVPIFLLNNK